MKAFLNAQGEEGAAMVEYAIAASILIAAFIIANAGLKSMGVEKGREIVITSTRTTPCNAADSLDPIQLAITDTVNFNKSDVCQ